jgi:hypothetical protein
MRNVETEVDIYDPQDLAAFIKETIQEALAEHRGTLVEAHGRAEYGKLAAARGHEDGFADTFSEAMKLYEAGGGKLSLADAYEKACQEGGGARAPRLSAGAARLKEGLDRTSRRAKRRGY